MGFGDFEPRGAARFQNRQQSTWRNGVQWHIGERVTKFTFRMMPCPRRANVKIQEPAKTLVEGTITGFEANHKNRPSVKWDEQPAPFSTPPHFLQEWWDITKTGRSERVQ